MADRNVPTATIAVAAKCSPPPTRFMPQSITPKKLASRKKKAGREASVGHERSDHGCGAD
jgi:hypothetical protein